MEKNQTPNENFVFIPANPDFQFAQGLNAKSGGMNSGGRGRRIGGPAQGMQSPGQRSPGRRNPPPKPGNGGMNRAMTPGEKSPIPDDYCLAKYPVTNAEYQQFLRENPSYRAPKYWVNGTFPQGKANHPVLRFPAMTLWRTVSG